MAIADAIAESKRLDPYTEQMKRNITAVLKMRGRLAKDVAVAIGMSAATFSQRLNGDSRWLAVEIARLAAELRVNPGVLLAETEKEFSERLAASPCLLHIPFGTDPHQLSFDDLLIPRPALVAL